MTIGIVRRDNVILFPIPPAPKRRVAPQQTPAALSKGLSARSGAVDPLFAGRKPHLGVTTVAAVDEIAESGELLTCRGLLSGPLPAGVRIPSGAAVACCVGSGPVGRCRCRPFRSSAGCRASRRNARRPPSRRLRSRDPPNSQGVPGLVPPARSPLGVSEVLADVGSPAQVPPKNGRRFSPRDHRPEVEKGTSGIEDGPQPQRNLDVVLPLRQGFRGVFLGPIESPLV
jgi:hypothetical protein